MKIASLVPYKFIPPQKGGERAIFYFLKNMALQAPVTCFTVEENASNIDNITFSAVLGKTSHKARYINPFLFFKISKELKKQDLRHIIVEHPYYGWLGYLLKKINGTAFIIRSHNIEALRFKTMHKWWWPVLQQYEKFAHRQADLNFFITEEDRLAAIAQYGLDPAKCAVASYGMPLSTAPSLQEKAGRKAWLCAELGIAANTTLILYNGTLDYLPNRNGLDKILQQINPRLEKKMQPYKIIVCGPNLPADYEQLQAYTTRDILYQGFVKNIEDYFAAADIFINPITEGGGIKTKLVEALAANARAVSFRSGAWGLSENLTGGKLIVAEDDDYDAFAEAIIAAANMPPQEIPQSFLQYFNWEQIAKKALARIESISSA